MFISKCVQYDLALFYHHADFDYKNDWFEKTHIRTKQKHQNKTKRTKQKNKTKKTKQKKHASHFSGWFLLSNA